MPDDEALRRRPRPVGSWETRIPNLPCCPLAVGLWPSRPPLGLSFLLVQRAGAPLSCARCPSPSCSLSPQPRSSPDPCQGQEARGAASCVCGRGATFFVLTHQATSSLGTGVLALSPSHIHSFIHSLIQAPCGAGSKGPRACPPGACLPVWREVRTRHGGWLGPWGQDDIPGVLFPEEGRGGAGPVAWTGRSKFSLRLSLLICKVCVQSHLPGLCEERTRDCTSRTEHTATQETLGLV